MRPNLSTIIINTWGSLFLVHLRKEARKIGAWDSSKRKNIKRAARRLYDKGKGELRDIQAGVIVAMCSVVLASYREMLADVKDVDLAEKLAGDAMFTTARSAYMLMTRIELKLLRDPVSALSRVSLARISSLMYGRSMEFDQEIARDRVSLIVNRCAFHQFFTDNGEPHLTRLLCRYDRNWMDLVNASNRPVRIDRPSTISTGSPQCLFHFARDQEPRKKEARDVVSS
jgi:hypothetical protein